MDKNLARKNRSLCYYRAKMAKNYGQVWLICSTSSPDIGPDQFL